MHLSRILDQIKRHPSPTEALTKLGKAGFITINAIMLFRL